MKNKKINMFKNIERNRGEIWWEIGRQIIWSQVRKKYEEK